MPEPNKSFFDWIDVIAEKAAKITCYLVFVIMLITTADVVARYVFNRPLVWGWLLNRQLFGVFILFAGVYTLFKGEHIRIEILYDHFPRELKIVAKWIGLLAFISFMGAFRIPWYPFKLLIPAVAFLFLLEGIAAFRRGDD
jgi:TRAP-type mannitol/chloroaromatic compound transport system permease small subunit